MSDESAKVSNRVYIGIVVGALIITALVAGWFFRQTGISRTAAEHDARPPASPSDGAALPVPSQPMVIDYGDLEKNQALNNLMQQRKAQFGVETGVDVIINSDESLKIGGNTVSMREILDKIRLKRGDILEKNLDLAGMDAPDKTEIEIFGIYVVQPGDNIWNIHFRFLKDYFSHRNISISPQSDEPDSRGFSSGVGKLLKFSEHLVYVYNITDRRIDVDLNLIQPLSKLVVYNMTQVFALLNQIDYAHVHRIQFDGETLWIPAEQ